MHHNLFLMVHIGHLGQGVDTITRSCMFNTVTVTTDYP